jgi:hypothetical protein
VTATQRFVTDPARVETAIGAGKARRRQYVSGWTSCRCCARSRSDFVATKTDGMWSREYCCYNISTNQDNRERYLRVNLRCKRKNSYRLSRERK